MNDLKIYSSSILEEVNVRMV